MKNLPTIKPIVHPVLFLFTILLSFALPARTYAQMSSTVNSLADDEFAHPWDDPDTEEDESIDGICVDEQQRCTLRAALEEAAIIEVSALVTFDGSLSGNLTVNDMNGPLSPPDNSVIQGVRQKVIIYGSSSGSILLTVGNSTTITGLGFANGLIGVLVGGDNNLIGASLDPVNLNYFHHFSQNGILVVGNKNSISGNRIGIAFDNTPAPNQFGIFITGGGNVIGGTGQGQGNIISGNDIGIGVYTLQDSTYIYGNKIGTDSSGILAVPNRVGIDNIGPNVFVGNNTTAGMNVISGNIESGVLFGIGSTGSSVLKNNIGTDPSGLISVPNRDGITLGPGTKSTRVSGNVIKFNSQNGILVSGINVTDLTTQNNLISGNTIQQNGNAGIAFTGAALDNVIGSSLSNTNEPNEISNNGQVGVVFAPGVGEPQRNTIRENIFLDNTSYGIRILAGQGGIQPPDFESYTDNGNTAVIIGTHQLPGAIIDLYKGDVNQGNRLEGIEWIGSGPVDANGFFSIQISSCICDSIVATATDALGNTSQFSDGIGTITALHDPSDLSMAVKPFPNPFYESVQISFELLQPADVTLVIYDLYGRKIKTLIDDSLPAGKHVTSWTPDSQCCGIYYYQLNVGNQPVTTGKMIYME